MSVESAAAGRLLVAAKSDAAPGATVAVAVRPEKLRISGEKPSPQPDNCVPATVADIGYLGGVSLYKLTIGEGMPVKAAVANVARFAERAIGVGQEVWVSWPAEAAIVLTR